MGIINSLSKIVPSLGAFPKTIQPGMHFQQCLEGSPEWRVKRKVTINTFNIPHYILEDLEGRLETRIISESGLRNKRFFHYVPSDPVFSHGVYFLEEKFDQNLDRKRDPISFREKRKTPKNKISLQYISLQRFPFQKS